MVEKNKERLFPKTIIEQNKTEFNYLGHYHPWTWHIIENMPRNGLLLIGKNKTDPCDSGYIYAPYVPLTRSLISQELDGSNRRYGYLTRYAKKLVKREDAMYAQLTFDKEDRFQRDEIKSDLNLVQQMLQTQF